MRFALLLVFVLRQALVAQRGGPAVRSPDVHADGRVTFRLAAPNATEVRLSGDFLATPQALVKDEKGIWIATVGPVTPEIYGHQLPVNGVLATRGTLDVPGTAPMFYDLRPVPHGAVEQRWYQSKTIGDVRRVFIYTPPGYGQSSERYPMLSRGDSADAGEGAAPSRPEAGGAGACPVRHARADRAALRRPG